MANWSGGGPKPAHRLTDPAAGADLAALQLVQVAHARRGRLALGRFDRRIDDDWVAKMIELKTTP